MKRVLVEGDAAPEFDALSVTGDTVSLRSYHDGFLMLAFMRYSGCPYCNLAIHRLAVEYPRLKANGCEVIAFIQSSKQNIDQAIYQRHAVRPPFPIVADPAMHVYERYGVSASALAAVRDIKNLPYWVQSVAGHKFTQQSFDGKHFLVPAYFLIDAATGRIVRAHYGSSFYEHETFTKIYEPLVFKDA